MPQGPQPQPPSTSRIEVIDGLRGLFLILMTTTHLELAGRFLFKRLHPDTVSFIDAAYGFVFLSGLVVGLVYTRALVRGRAPALGRLRRRTAEVYLCAVGLVLALMLAAALAPGFAEATHDWLGPLAAPDARAIAGGLLLLQGADYADILAPYVVYMLVAPVALEACLAGGSTLVLGVSVLLWLAAQFGAGIAPAEGLAVVAQTIRPDLHPPTEFNVLAWQLLFFVGLVLGAAASRGRLSLERWFPVGRPWPLFVALGMLAVCAGLTLALHHLPPDSAARLETGLAFVSSKPRLGVLCITNFAAAAYTVLWLVVAAPTAGAAWLRTASEAARRVLSWSFLRLLGRHSLYVYVWHVALVYAVRLVDVRYGPFGEPAKDLIALAVFAAMAAPALVRERLASGRRAAALAAA